MRTRDGPRSGTWSVWIGLCAGEAFGDRRSDQETEDEFFFYVRIFYTSARSRIGLQNLAFHFPNVDTVFLFVSDSCCVGRRARRAAPPVAAHSNNHRSDSRTF